MKIVNISGGLGNQMFQYAFALLLKQKYPSQEVLVDTHHYHSLFFKKFRGINLHNGYEINNIFPNSTLRIASASQIQSISRYVPNYILSRIIRKILPKKKTEYIHPYSMTYAFDANALEIENDCYYEGFWQSFYYYYPIIDLLKKEFAHPIANTYNEALISDICSCESVGMHIRRGDYLAEPEYRGICDKGYYSKCISHIKRNVATPVFFIFSNDLSWCKNNIVPLIGNSRYVLVSENKGKYSCWDMFLMTYCKTLIVANSSFSWWAAFLNHNTKPIIYCPDPWVRRDCKMDVYSPDWIKIKR